MFMHFLPDHNADAFNILRVKLTFKKSMQYKQLRCFVNLSVHVLVCVFSLKSIVGDKRRMIWIFGCVITQILNDCSVILLTT